MGLREALRRLLLRLRRRAPARVETTSSGGTQPAATAPVAAVGKVPPAKPTTEQLAAAAGLANAMPKPAEMGQRPPSAPLPLPVSMGSRPPNILLGNLGAAPPAPKPAPALPTSTSNVAQDVWSAMRTASLAVPGASQVLAAAEATMKVNAASAKVVQALGGSQGRQDLATVVLGPRVALGQAMDSGAKAATQAVANFAEQTNTPVGTALAAVLKNEDVQRKVGQLGFATGVLGPIGAVGKVAGEVVSAGIRAVAGEKVESAVRNVFAQADVSMAGTLASKAVAAGADFIRSLPFMPKSEPPPREHAHSAPVNLKPLPSSLPSTADMLKQAALRMAKPEERERVETKLAAKTDSHGRVRREEL